jgi:hypothetical protein
MENSIKLKYKRISGFANMNDILLEIDKLKQKYDKDIGIIIKTLESKYQKSIDEIKGYLLEWEKKYSSSKSSKISSEFKSGILVSISNNNIIINGITKLYQIPLLYKFFTTFLNMFISYNELEKNKEFKKVFSSKNLNTNIKYYNQDYELNNISHLNINKIYETEYNLNNEILLDDEYDDIEKSLLENMNGLNGMNLISNGQIEGLASDDEIDPNIKLVCDDPLPEKDTCKDFCNDQEYFLRRLQRYDNTLFKSSTDKKLKKQYSFARQCQSQSQPVILGYDPEKNENIKRSSFTYSVKYGSKTVKLDEV